MTRQTFLVTGATDGIGKQTALNLACQGIRVLVHGRNRAKAEAATAELRKAAGSDDLEAVAGDYTSLRDVHALAEEVRAKTPRLDGLIHNAGVYMKTRVLTADGLETTFQVNHLASFLLTHLLLDRLDQSRIIVVSSVAHQGGHVDFHNLQGEKLFDGYSAYTLSKLANLLFATELAQRLGGTGTTVNSLHPGAVGTKLLRAGFDMDGIDVKQGARTPTYLALSPDVATVTGRYFTDCKPTACSIYASDAALRTRFWETSETLVKLSPAQRIPRAAVQV